MAFQCVVVTPEQQVMDESVRQVVLPAADGMLGIQTGRAPMLAQLGAGALRVDSASGQSHRFFIEGGVAQMKNNKLTILTNEAHPISELNADEARREFDQAVAMRATDEKARKDRQKAIDRARAKERVAQSK